MTTRILLVDHQSIFREAVRAFIEKRRDFTIVGEASDGQHALDLALKLDPDVVLTEISLPLLSGLELTRRLRSSEGCNARVLVLTMHDRHSHISEALKAGAAGYLLKSGSADQLLDAIDAVRSGRTFLSPEISHHVIAMLRGGADRAATGISALSSREREVLQLVAEGLSSKEIANDLGLSTRTVESHRHKLMEKIGVNKVSGLVRFAIREGLVNP